MADVEKININSTNYDVRDANALHNKATGVSSIVEQNSGNASYPTTTQTYSTVIGYTARVVGSYNYNTVYGYSANSSGFYGTCVGAYAATYAYGTAVGSSSNSSNYGVAIGYNSRNSNSYSVAVGYQSKNSSYYGVAIGNNATSTGNYTVALGSNAIVSSGNAVQLGQGTNSAYNTLQFRDWRLLDSNGKIPVERIPQEVMGGGDTPIDLYNIVPEDDNRHIVYQYTGTTNPLFTSNYFYRSEVRYSYPVARCVWVADEFIKEKEDVTIDQEKFFKQLIRASRTRPIDQGIAGGGNNSMGMYFYYNGTDKEWHIEFGDDNIEGHATPDSFEGITDLAEWGIYLNESSLTLPEEDEEDIFDITYMAPLYFDNYDWGSDYFQINYEKLLSGLNDGDWGVGVVEPDWKEHTISVDTVNVSIPILPKKYYEEDGITFRFEWDEYESEWVQYINGDSIGYSWTTESLDETFGIHVEGGDEGDVEYIEFTVKPARQMYWEYCNPIDTSLFMMKDPAQTAGYVANKQQILTHNTNAELEWTTGIGWDDNVVDLTGTANRLNLNTLTTAGWYKYQGQLDNAPTGTNSTQAPVLIRVVVNGYPPEHVAFTVSQRLYVTLGNSGNPKEWYRYKIGGSSAPWLSWEGTITTKCAPTLSNFVQDTRQKLIHQANSSSFAWVADTSGTIDYDDLDNKPQIGGTELSGDKSLSDLGIAPATSLGGMALWKGTTAQYNAITTKDANTLYIITE